MNADLPLNQNYLVPTLDAMVSSMGTRNFRDTDHPVEDTPIRYDFGAVIPDQHIINLPFPIGI